MFQVEPRVDVEAMGRSCHSSHKRLTRRQSQRAARSRLVLSYRNPKVKVGSCILYLHESCPSGSWLIFDVRCFRSCPAAHILRGFGRRQSAGVADETLVVRGSLSQATWSVRRCGAECVVRIVWPGLNPRPALKVAHNAARRRWLLLSQFVL